MANVLVFMDQQEGHLLEHAKQVLGEGRRIASHLGAILYGLTAEPSEPAESWIAEAGLGGADKLVLLSNIGQGDFGSTLNMAEAIAEFCSTVKPNLVLFAESADTRSVGSALAARLGALFLADATCALADDGSLTMVETNDDRLAERVIAASEVAVPVVATLSLASLQPARGSDDADLIFFKASGAESRPQGLTQTKSWNAALSSAPLVVIAGLGAKDHLSQVDALAASMGAKRASTKSLWLAGLAEEESVVDWTQNRIAPRLCIICGAFGSSSHLSAISAGSTIIALGRDPMSPAIRASHYALLGDLRDTLPAMTDEALRLRSAAE